MVKGGAKDGRATITIVLVLEEGRRIGIDQVTTMLVTQTQMQMKQLTNFCSRIYAHNVNLKLKVMMMGSSVTNAISGNTHTV